MQDTQYSATCNKNVRRRVPLPEDEIAEQIWRHALNYRFSGKERSFLPSFPSFCSPSFNMFPFGVKYTVAAAAADASSSDTTRLHAEGRYLSKKREITLEPQNFETQST